MDTRIVGAIAPATSRRIWGLALASLVGGGIAAYLANRLGWWWVTPLAGVAAALLIRRWQALLVCILLGTAAWAAGLYLQAGRDYIGRIAQVTGGLAGLGDHAGGTVVALTIGYGGLLCLAGGWLTLAVLPRAARVGPAAAIEAAGAAAEPSAEGAEKLQFKEIPVPESAPVRAGSVASKESDHG